MRIENAMLAAVMAASVTAAIYEPDSSVKTFVGSGFQGTVDGVGRETMFNRPSDMTASPTGVFVNDRGNNALRHVTTNMVVTTVLTGLDISGGMAMDTNGNLFAAGGAYVWMLPFGGREPIRYAGANNPGYADGTRVTAQFGINPGGIAVSKGGTIYVSDTENRRIRKISGNDVSTLAGSGNDGHADGRGIFSSFRMPSRMAVDEQENVFVVDAGYIRRIDKVGQVQTVAGGGSGTSADGPAMTSGLRVAYGLCIDANGNIIFTDLYAPRKLTPEGNLRTIAGSLEEMGYKDAEGSLARFNTPFGAAIMPDGRLVVSDFSNNVIRLIERDKPTETFAVAPRLAMGVAITGIPGTMYRVESSDEVSPNTWRELGIFVLTNSPYHFFDARPLDASKRFYRAVRMP